MAYMRQRRIGMGAYDHTGDWTWEFYPYPYNFLAPRDSAPMPAPILYPARSSRPGLSGCGCGGSCGGCGDHGGLGLFDSGLDLSQWGFGEWTMAAGTAFLLWNVLSGAVKGTRAVKKYSRRRKSAARRKQELREELRSLGA